MKQSISIHPVKCITIFTISSLVLSCNYTENNTNCESTNSEVNPEKNEIIANSNDKTNPQEKNKYKFVKSIPVPDEFIRIEAEENSFAGYLRNLIIKQENNTVYLYDGTPKGYQDAQFAVIKMDIGNKDLQQCADAVMRLRAEYLYANKRYDEIHFNFLSDGKPRYYLNYSKNDFSYKKFRKYMDYIFAYANTASLNKELNTVDNITDIKIGDVFIQTGNPYGHAIIVIDIAKHEVSGKKIFMLAQSYMPAQEIHILINPEDLDLSPWYDVNFETELNTPEWIFKKENLKRF